MKTKSAPKPVSSPPPLGSYLAEFERWIRDSPRHKSTGTEDIYQEIRLALWEFRDTPATLEEARRIFLRLVNIFELRAKRQVRRQGTLVESPRELEELAGSIERDTVRWLALFDALEKLTDHERWLVKECKIEGRTYADVAKQLGVSEEAITSRPTPPTLKLAHHARCHETTHARRPTLGSMPCRHPIPGPTSIQARAEAPFTTFNPHCKKAARCPIGT